MKQSKCIIVLLFFLFGCSSDKGSDTPADTVALNCSAEAFPSDLKDLITAKLAEYPLIPGAVVSIYHPVHGYVISSFGYSNKENQTPMPLNGVFGIGSVHKVFKWILLEKLADDGLLSFTETLASRVATPSIPGALVGDLAHHSTGMVDIGSVFINDVLTRHNAGALPYDYSYADMVNILGTEPNSGFVPGFVVGTMASYSSYGPVVAAEIAKSITGKTTVEMLRGEIINPLNLQSTKLIGYDEHPSNFVQGYGNPDTSNSTEPYGVLPAGIRTAVSSGNAVAMYSTACDMAHFTRAISDPAVNFISSSTISSRITSAINQGSGSINERNFGRGVLQYSGYNTGNFWGHGGNGTMSHSSMIAYNPDDNISVAIHTNLDPVFIENEFGLHNEVVKIINEFF